MAVENQEVINEGMRKDIEFIKDNLKEINNKLDQKYVTHDEFRPIQKIVYGLVGTVLLAFLGGVIALILK